MPTSGDLKSGQSLFWIWLKTKLMHRKVQNSTLFGKFGDPRAHTVLKSPWIPFFLEKSLNCYASPWKVLEFSSTLNAVARKVFFFMLFGCPRQNMNHSSENLKVIYTKCSMFYAIINYQFKTNELKNVEKLVKQTVQAFKVLLE